MSILLALMIAQAGMTADACKNPRTQRDMNACAALDFEAADRELNSQWTLTSAEMRQMDSDARPRGDNRAGYFNELLTAQRLWISFRDAHCVSEGYGARGGSMEPMLVAGCKATLTRQRTAQLRDLANAG